MYELFISVIFSIFLDRDRLRTTETTEIEISDKEEPQYCTYQLSESPNLVIYDSASQTAPKASREIFFKANLESPGPIWACIFYRPQVRPWNTLEEQKSEGK